MTALVVPPGRVGTRPVVGYAMVLGAAVLFAFNGTVSKLVLQAGLDARHLTELRCTVALVVLVALAVATGPARLRVTWRELPWLAVYGVVGYAMVQWLYYVAIERLPVGIALLFEFTAPLMVALWARFGGGQQVRRRVWFALGLCLAGLACVAQVWGGGTLDGVGIAAGLASAVALATYYVLGERAIGSRDTLSVACWAFAFAALLWAVVEPWWLFPFEVLTRDAASGLPVWVLLLYVVSGGTVIPFLLILSGMRHLSATTAGIVGMTEPVIASLIAWVLIGEHLTTPQLLGGAAVLVGIVIAQTARRPAPTVPAEFPL
ncbi:MAG TPA: EamA family transporter [Cryptosporangiaceae bacterium]|nr:EamA family transporter [Cryptosporangiaceae bacterium]